VDVKLFYDLIQAPAAVALAGIATAFKNLASEGAALQMLAIAGQESGWASRLQQPIPDARGFWQCERLGAVLSVLTGDRSGPVLRAVCNAYAIPPGLDEVTEAIAWHDPLAYALARLALAGDPPALPAIGDEEGAWETYARVWRPGKPSRERWKLIYPAAQQVIRDAVPSQVMA
jgi:hypothetical protein